MSVMSIFIALVLVITLGMSTQMSTYNAQAAGKVKLSKTKAVVHVGNNTTLKLKGAKASRVKWSSSNTRVAKVSKKGVVTALKKGKTVITAKYNKKVYKCTITVMSAKISKKKLVLQATYGYDLTVLNTKGKVKWTSSNKSIATVDKNGHIKAKKSGRVKIIAKVQGEKYACSLKVVPKISKKDFYMGESYNDKWSKSYTNYIDMIYAEGTNWYSYWCDPGSGPGVRGLKIGDTYSDFENAYGSVDKYWPDESSNNMYKRSYTSAHVYSGIFKNLHLHPSYMVGVCYWKKGKFIGSSNAGGWQITYMGSQHFYFDKDDKLVLVVFNGED